MAGPSGWTRPPRGGPGPGRSIGGPPPVVLRVRDSAPAASPIAVRPRAAGSRPAAEVIDRVDGADPQPGSAPGEANSLESSDVERQAADSGGAAVSAEPAASSVGPVVRADHSSLSAAATTEVGGVSETKADTGPSEPAERYRTSAGTSSTRVRRTLMPSAPPWAGVAITSRQPRLAVTTTSSASPRRMYQARSPGRSEALAEMPTQALMGRQRTRSGAANRPSPSSTSPTLTAVAAGSSGARA